MMVSKDLSLQFNPSKSYCIAVGKCDKLATAPTTLGHASISLVQSVKYLSVTINRCKSLSTSLSPPPVIAFVHKLKILTS